MPNKCCNADNYVKYLPFKIKGVYLSFYTVSFISYGEDIIKSYPRTRKQCSAIHQVAVLNKPWILLCYHTLQIRMGIASRLADLEMQHLSSPQKNTKVSACVAIHNFHINKVMVIKKKNRVATEPKLIIIPIRQ